MAIHQRVTGCCLGVLSSVVLLAGPIQSAAAAEEKPPEKINFMDHVRPIFRQHCFACHNQNKKQNDLAVDLYESMMEGGASGEVIEPGDPEASYLWLLVSHEDEPAMPPNQDRMPDDQLAVIRKWIEGGALKDAGSKAVGPKKPAMDLSVSVGAARPEGPAVMPEGLRREPFVRTERAGALTAIAASPWSPVVAVAGQQQIVLYNSDTGQYLGVLPFPEGIPYVLKFSRSGALLLAGGGKGAYQGLVVVYDVKTGDRVFEVGDELDAVLAADINADHSYVALGGPQKIVRVFSTKDGSLVYEIRKHTDWIYSVEFSPDGVLLATGDRSGGLRVWEAFSGREFHNLDGKHKAAVSDVTWRSDSNVLASASKDGTIKLWEMENGGQIKSTNAHGGGVAAIEFTHDGRLATCGRDKVAKAWDASGGQIRAFEAFPDLALEVAFTHDGKRVVAGDWTGLVRMWQVEDGARVAELSPNPPTLDMIIAKLSEEAAPKLAAAAGANAALDAATKELAAKQQQAEATAKTLAQKTEAASQAQEKAKTAQAALGQAAEGDDRQAAEQAAGQAAEAANKANQEAEAARAAAEKAKAEAEAANKAVVEKTAAAKTAADAAKAAQAAIAQVEAEKAALEQSEKPDA